MTGEDAPVNKPAAYCTVNNIPREPRKCWVTSNLGTEYHPTAEDSTTVATAGWYWQFNRKQGFKHEGTAITRARKINSIGDNSDWIADNDLYTLEMDSGWHIPNKIEWTKPDASGNCSYWKVL